MLKSLFITTAFLLALTACSSEEAANQPSQRSEESSSHPTPSHPTVAEEEKQDAEASVLWPTGIDKTQLAVNTKRPPTRRPATLPPELADIAAPAVNEPFSIEPPTPLPPIEPKLPDDGLPAIQTFIDGKHFEGTFHGSGDVEITTDSIKMDAGPKGSVKILYRMPTEMGMLAPRSLKGELGLSDRTTIEDRNRIITLKDDKGLYFAEVWQREQSPLSFQISETLKLQQSEVGETAQSGAMGSISQFIHPDITGGGGEETDSRLQLIDGDRVVTEVDLGTVTDIDSPIGLFKVFVSESQLFQPAPGTPGVHQAYVLRLWIARAR